MNERTEERIARDVGAFDSPHVVMNGKQASSCCSIGFTSDDTRITARLRPGPRLCRAIAGLMFFVLALSLAHGAARWPFLWFGFALLLWFGVSHVVAAITGYSGCPELGSIPSVILRRHVGTYCGPWTRLDQWFE